jgi:hypothetical protein
LTNIASGFSTMHEDSHPGKAAIDPRRVELASFRSCDFRATDIRTHVPQLPERRFERIVEIGVSLQIHYEAVQQKD